MKQLGEDMAEQREFVRATFRVIRYVRPKLACGCCDTIVHSLAPRQPIERGIAGRGLLANVLAAMCAHHLPRCTVSPPSMRAKASIWTGLCWPTGSVSPARYCAPWLTRSASTCWPLITCMLMPPRAGNRTGLLENQTGRL